MASFPLLSTREIAELRQQVATRAEDLARELSWLDDVEVVQPAAVAPPTELTVVAFNAERGSRFEGIRTLLTEHPALRAADVILLSEVDWGMARSGNRHVARELADAVGMGYAFGIEFVELTKGDDAELEVSGENTYSFHGNAILSRQRLENVRTVRLPRRHSWASGSQQRVGGRMALVADIVTSRGSVSFATVHLENRTDPQGRLDQMQALLDAIGTENSCVIAGDLNTSTIDAGIDEQIFSVPALLAENPDRLRRPERFEPLFAQMRAAGFLIDEINPDGVPTCVPPGIEDPAYWLKLDWMFSRGLRPLAIGSVVVAEHERRRVSDHEFLVGRFSVD